MKCRLLFAAIVCSVAAASIANAPADTIQVQVGAGGLKFTPQNVSIQVGDTVQWTWAASGHSTTSGTPGHPDGLWDSGIQNSGFTFTHTFDEAGTFAYFCIPHGSLGMVGSVTVAEAVDTIAITRAQYNGARSQLTVQATDSNPSAVLTVSQTSTGTIIGQMMNKGGGNYTAKFNGIANPLNITVTSNLGGSATARVRGR